MFTLEDPEASSTKVSLTSISQSALPSAITLALVAVSFCL